MAAIVLVALVFCKSLGGGMQDRAGRVLVVGATGNQGGAAARALLERGWPVRGLVRDPTAPAARALRAAGAELVTGDLDDPGSLREAMRDVHGVFLVLTMMTGPRVTPEGVAAEERRGRAVVELAAKAGVAHLVYSSIRGADRQTGVSYIESKARIEAHIRGLGVPATVLRPVSFMDNFTTYNRPVLADGTLTVSLALRPETPLSMVAASDIGVFAAAAFDRPDRFLGVALEVAGDALTGPAIADVIGRAYRLPARFQPLPIEQLRAFDPEVAAMFELVDAGTFDSPDLAALRAIHPGLLTLEAWAREHLGEPQ
jgi:uncharacterized protein YbjT (DUF2867 family)